MSSEGAASTATARRSVLRALLAVGAVFLAARALAEEWTWVQEEPLPQALLWSLVAALPWLILSATLVFRDRISERIRIWGGSRLGLAACAGAIFLVIRDLNDGRPMRSIAVLLGGLAAIRLTRGVIRFDRRALTGFIAGAAATALGFLFFAAWSDGCGAEALFGGCSEPGYLAEERLLADLDTSSSVRLVSTGRSGATGRGSAEAIYVAAPQSVSGSELGIPAGYSPYESGAAIADDREYHDLLEWKGPSPKPGAGDCVLEVYVDRDLDREAASVLHDMSDADINAVNEGELVAVQIWATCVDERGW